MVKLDKIYTRGGDQGQTSLGDGQRVHKNDLRVKTYGDFDEINAMLGITICYCSDRVKNSLSIIQNDIFDLGADLCIPDNTKKNKLKVNLEQVLFLENNIDKMNEDLEPLNSFILPGGSKASSFLHLARCITRRAERSLSELNQNESINDYILQYINRLSDFLFVAARYENMSRGDILWEPAKSQI
tara:strand:- start:3547 stop:4104 length:558 start_codon:yes stop_codon:yes gene_type:complete